MLCLNFVGLKSTIASKSHVSANYAQVDGVYVLENESGVLSNMVPVGRKFETGADERIEGMVEMMTSLSWSMSKLVKHSRTRRG